ncbi:MAG: hypothetical protein DRZ76_04580, partial [Candidatus Nealsonbacteria bacterium]
MPVLSSRDFDYYRGWIQESISEHEKQMQHINMPDEVVASYEGRIAAFEQGEAVTGSDIIENYLFIAVNTLLPTLFYQVPRPMIK